MAVTFTPNIGLAKPAEIELAREWVNAADLSDDNNLICETKMNIANTVVSSNPIIGATTNPAVGANGSSLLEWIKVQGFIFGTFVITAAGVGVSAGSGTGAYGIKLPELADATFHTVATSLADTPGVASCIGEAHLTVAASVATSQTLAIDIMHLTGIAYMRLITEAYTSKTQRWVGPTFPSTLAAGDKMVGSFFYKAA